MNRTILILCLSILALASYSQTKVRLESMEYDYQNFTKNQNDYFVYSISDKGNSIAYNASTNGFSYTINKHVKKTKKNFRLKSISFYKITPINRTPNFIYYGMTSIDVYTVPNNTKKWTYVVFKINILDKKTYQVVEKDFISNCINLKYFDNFFK